MINVTFLSSYEYCARKLFLEQVLKLVSIPKEVIVKGTVRHQVFDLINKREEKIVSSIDRRFAYSQIFELYKNQHAQVLRDSIINNKPKLREVNLSLIDMFKHTWPLILRESKNRADNLFEFIAKHEVYGIELWNQLTPKIESEFKIESETLKMRGIIDQIEIYDDNVVPYELKTGKAPENGVWPNHKLQVGAYVMLLESQNKTVENGFVKYLDETRNQKRPIMMNNFLRDRILKIRNEVINLLEQKTLPDYCDNKNKCESCSLKKECYNEKFMKEQMKKII
jgi:CRISPR-associated protein Cas4